jgi:hypothetical protein
MGFPDISAASNWIDVLKWLVPLATSIVTATIAVIVSGLQWKTNKAKLLHGSGQTIHQSTAQVFFEPRNCGTYKPFHAIRGEGLNAKLAASYCHGVLQPVEIAFACKQVLAHPPEQSFRISSRRFTESKIMPLVRVPDDFRRARTALGIYELMPFRLPTDRSKPRKSKTCL